MSYREHYSVIATSIKDSWESNRITFSEENGEFQCNFGLNIYQLFFPAVLSFLLPDSYKKKNQATIRELYTSFGEWRVKEVSQRWGLEIPYKYSHGSPLTCRDIKVLFAGLCDIRIEDIRRLYWDIRDNKASYLHLTEERANELQALFLEKSFSALRKPELDILYDLAIPFDDVQTIFCHDLPGFSKQSSPEFGSGALEQMKRRVFLLEEMRRSNDHSELAETVRKIKKVYNYFMPEGTVLPHSEGYTYVFRMINEHGCYKFFHKSMNTLDCPSIISHLGTQVANPGVPKSWETLLIDLHPNLGAAGAIATYEETNALLTRPELGFVEKDDELVDLTGVSLGGTLAFFDLCLFLNRVRKVSTVGNPGLDFYTLQTLAQKVRDLHRKIKINIVWDFDDYVRLLGDGHAGLYCDPKYIDLDVTYLVPKMPWEAHRDTVPENPVRPSSAYEAVSTILHCLFGPHLRETTMQEFRGETELERGYSVITLSNQNEEDRNLLNAMLDNRTKGWENLRRKMFSWIGRADLFYEFWQMVCEKTGVNNSPHQQSA